MSKATEETTIKTFALSRYMEKALINEEISKIKAYTGSEMLINFIHSRRFSATPINPCFYWLIESWIINLYKNQ